MKPDLFFARCSPKRVSRMDGKRCSHIRSSARQGRIALQCLLLGISRRQTRCLVVAVAPAIALRSERLKRRGIFNVKPHRGKPQHRSEWRQRWGSLQIRQITRGRGSDSIFHPRIMRPARGRSPTWRRDATVPLLRSYQPQSACLVGTETPGRTGSGELHGTHGWDTLLNAPSPSEPCADYRPTA